MTDLDHLAEELEAYARRIRRAVERDSIAAIPHLAATTSHIADRLRDEAESLNREAARDAFPNDGDAA